MKELFPEYYSSAELPDYDQLWDKSLIAFDSNVLLNLYGYTPEYRASWLAGMKLVSNQIFLPYQVAYEYHKNLKTKIQEVKDDTGKAVEEYFSASKKQLDTELPQLNPLRDNESIKKSRDGLVTAFESAIKDAKSNTEKWKATYDQDCLTLKEEIARIFSSDKVGKPPDVDTVKRWCELGFTRYEQNIPPGYKDKGKTEGNPYGDLFIWFELIDAAKRLKRPVIFVSFEQKIDWWHKEEKKIRPRRELANEFRLLTGCEFQLIDAKTFSHWASKRTGKNVASADQELEKANKTTKEGSVRLNFNSLRILNEFGEENKKMVMQTLHAIANQMITQPNVAYPKRTTVRCGDMLLDCDFDPKEGSVTVTKVSQIATVEIDEQII